MAVPQNHHVANLLDHVGHDFGTSAGPGRFLVRTKNTASTAGATGQPVLVAEMLAMVAA